MTPKLDPTNNASADNDPSKGLWLKSTKSEGLAPEAVALSKIEQADWARYEQFRTNWIDYFSEWRSAGYDSIALTFEWARLEPQLSRHNPAEIEFRQELTQTAVELGFSVTACLIDGSLPGWFAEDQGGFANSEALQLIWPRHVDWIGETFGHLITSWVPQREGVRQAFNRNKRSRHRTEAIKASVEADHQAWRLLKGTGPVATFQTVQTLEPTRDNIKAEREASNLETWLDRSWIEPLVTRGAFDQVIAGLTEPAIVTETGDLNQIKLAESDDWQNQSLGQLQERIENRPIEAHFQQTINQATKPQRVWTEPSSVDEP